jgi:hypothetical protein
VDVDFDGGGAGRRQARSRIGAPLRIDGERSRIIGALFSEVALVFTGGLCQVDYKPELYDKVRRPIWPLDPIPDPPGL